MWSAEFRAFAATCALGLALGCGEANEADPENAEVVLAPDGWTYDESVGPWSRLETEEDCSEQGFGPESAYFEVETDRCPWGSWAQELDAELRAGDVIEFDFHHLDLRAPVPATAVVELGVGEQVLWTLRRDIPSPAAFEQVEIEIDRAFEGGLAWFHVHNHGDNSYRLGTVRLTPR